MFRRQFIHIYVELLGGCNNLKMRCSGRCSTPPLYSPLQPRADTSSARGLSYCYSQGERREMRGHYVCHTFLGSWLGCP